MDRSVSDDACDRTHKAIEKQFDNVGKRLDAHSGSITSMQELLVRLTVVQEILVKTQETAVDNQKASIDNQKMQDKALATIDGRVLDRAVEAEKKFWESKLGERVINTAIVSFIIILLIALGQNVNFGDFIGKFLK